MRPKCEVNYHVSGGWCMRDGDCATCEAKHNGVCKRGLFVFTNEEKIASLVDALKELGVDVPVWRPIDSAPKDGTVVLGFWMSTKDIHQIMPICYDDSTGWYAVDFFSSSDGGPKAYPTHWTPLLTKPKE